MAIGKSGSQYGIFEFRVEFNFSKTKKTLHLALDTKLFSTNQYKLPQTDDG